MIRPAETLVRVGLAVAVPVAVASVSLKHLWKWWGSIGAMGVGLEVLCLIGAVGLGAWFLTWHAPLDRHELKFALTRYVPLALVFLVVYAFCFVCVTFGDCL